MEEIWVDIEDYPGYEVSNQGRVRRKSHTDCIKQQKTKAGTLVVPLSVNGIVKCRTVHIIVAVEFVPNPHNYSHVIHKDGNKLKNSASNLEWAELPADRKTKPVYMYDIEWEFIRKFKDAREAAEVMNMRRSRISCCCAGACDFAEGFRWSYYPPENIESFVDTDMERDIYQYDKKGDGIRAWGSITEASEVLKIPAWRILRCCKHLSKFAGGYGWEFVNNKIYED